jgi:lysozyme
LDNILDQLKRDEGFRLTAYPDSEGIPTIGYGHNLAAHGQTGITSCTQQQAEAWLLEDLRTVNLQLQKFLPWVFGLDVVRRGAIQNMTFNMGIHTMLTFTTFLGLVKAGNYDAAAEDELHTKWARQVGARAYRLSQQMKTGVWV